MAYVLRDRHGASRSVADLMVDDSRETVAEMLGRA
jgi:hypothetical protein